MLTNRSLKIKYVFPLLILLIPVFVKADDGIRIDGEDIFIDWGAWPEDREMTATIFGQGDWSDASARIDFDSNGSKKIMFLLNPKISTEPCRISRQGKSEPTIFYVNEQAIKGKVWCSNFANTGNRLYYLEAISVEANQFIVNSFIRHASVALKTPLANFKLSAIGFSKIWKQTSSKAL